MNDLESVGELLYEGLQVYYDIGKPNVFRIYFTKIYVIIFQWLYLSPYNTSASTPSYFLYRLYVGDCLSPS